MNSTKEGITMKTRLTLASLAVILLGLAVASVARGAAYTAGLNDTTAVAKANRPFVYFKGCQLSCGATKTVITCSASFTVRSRAICNTSDTDIYVGGTEVTTSVGGILKVGMCMPSLPDTGASTLIFDCAVTGGGKSLSVWEAG